MNTPIKSKNHIYIYIYIWLAFLLLILSSCTDAGVESGASKSTSVDVRTITYTGYIIDSAVEGLGYVCENDLGKSSTGKTNAEGMLEYPGLSSCKLTLGQVTLGSFSPSGTTFGILQNYYSPYDIWPDAPLKAAAFLQTLDDNTNASDGIKIPATISGDAATVTGEIIFDASLDLSTNTVVTALRTAHGSNPAVVAETAAETNMRSGIIEAAAKKFKRHYNSPGSSLASVVKIGNKEVEVVDLTSNNTSCVSNDGKLSSSPCVASLSAKFKYDSETSSAQTWNAYVGNKTKVGPFELYGEYITQHVYFVNVVATEPMDEEVSFVVVKKEKGNSAPKLSSIDAQAKVVRRFKSGDADLSVRPIYLAWDDNLAISNFKSFITNLSKPIEYNATNHPWVLTAESAYNLYIYKGADSYTHSFKTLGYKTSLADYVAELPGSRNQIAYNTGLDRISVKGYIERKETEPAVYNHLYGPGFDETYRFEFFVNNVGVGFCNAGFCNTIPILYFNNGNNAFPLTDFLGIRQFDVLLYAKRTYNADGTLQALASPLVMKVDLNGVVSSVTYKTVTE